MNEETPVDQAGEEVAQEVQIDPAKLQALLESYRMEQNLVSGIAFGLAAAIVGAGVWAAITAATEMQIGWMAVGVGFLVGVAVRVGGKGIDKSFQVAGGVLALFGCLLGNLLTACYFLSLAQDVDFLTVLAALQPALAFELIQLTFSPMDALFYAIAVYEGYRFSMRTISHEDMLRITADDKAGAATPSTE